MPSTLATLAAIQHRVQESIPWENLDTVLHGGIDLNPKSVYDKIVLRRRGGSCREINGLLAWALKEMGFSVRVLSCRNWYSREKEWGSEFDHLLPMVTMGEEEYLVEGGWGATMVREDKKSLYYKLILSYLLCLGPVFADKVGRLGNIGSAYGPLQSGA